MKPVEDVVHIRRPWAQLTNAVYKCGRREFEAGKPRARGAVQNRHASCAACIEVENAERAAGAGKNRRRVA